MRRALLLALVLAACSACAGLFGPAADPRLASWQAQASDLRGLPFDSPVRLEWVAADEFPALIHREVEGAFTPETARRYRDGYAALGVFPPSLDLVEMMMRLQSESIAGLYSSRRRTLYVLDTLRDDAQGANPTQSVIVVHELVHALQQQHAPEALELLTRLRHQDDVVGALSAMLEGDATFTMLGVNETQSGAGGRNEATAARVRQSMLAELEREGSPLAEAPRLLRESLVFPYAYGTPLSAGLFAREGTAGLDAALRDPPLSTLRVLAPDDTDPVEFVRLPMVELAAQLGARGCTLGEDNVAGALTLRVLFDEYGGAPDIDGLLRSSSGDRFLQIDCGGTWELVWLTRWDSAEAAAHFASAYRAIADGVAASAPLSGAPEVVVRERTALVVTPGLRPQVELILGGSEIRAYASFLQWRADDCFPEGSCPVDAGN